MKNKTIEIPPSGALVQFVLRAGASSGQAVIVASDDVEIRVKDISPIAEGAVKSQSVAKSQKTTGANPQAANLDIILKRGIKLKPTKRDAAVNSIEAMFQFDAPISKEVANKILEDLRKRGSLTIDANDKIQFRPA